jgi:thiamine biosynthesis lipoprotein
MINVQSLSVRAMRHAKRPPRLLAILALGAALAGDAACTRDPLDSATSPACDDLTPSDAADLPRHLRAERRLMGTAFQVHAVHAGSAAACRAMHAALDEVDRLEALLSEYRPSSQIALINRAAGDTPVEVDPEVLWLLERARRTTEITEGAFDITFASCARLWSIREQRVPESQHLEACLDNVGPQHLVLDGRRSTAWLPRTGTAIGLGGIGKGYAADRAADVLLAHGVHRFVIDAGGDLLVHGTDLDGPWSVILANPRDADRPYGTLRLDRGAVVTSGDYVRFFERDDVRYHHIFDPATGYPARRSVAVTVLAPSAADADALATGLFVLGPDRGLAVAARLPGVEALFVAPDLTVHRTPGFPAVSPDPVSTPSDGWPP